MLCCSKPLYSVFHLTPLVPFMPTRQILLLPNYPVSSYFSTRPTFKSCYPERAGKLTHTEFFGSDLNKVLAFLEIFANYATSVMSKQVKEAFVEPESHLGGHETAGRDAWFPWTHRQLQPLSSMASPADQQEYTLIHFIFFPYSFS